MSQATSYFLVGSPWFTICLRPPGSGSNKISRTTWTTFSESLGSSRWRAQAHDTGGAPWLEGTRYGLLGADFRWIWIYMGIKWVEFKKWHNMVQPFLIIMGLSLIWIKKNAAKMISDSWVVRARDVDQNWYHWRRPQL